MNLKLLLLLIVAGVLHEVFSYSCIDEDNESTIVKRKTKFRPHSKHSHRNTTVSSAGLFNVTNLTEGKHRKHNHVKKSHHHVTKVFGGDPALISDWPFLLQLTVDGNLKGTAFVVNANWALTAAQNFLVDYDCTRIAGSRMRLRIGSQCPLQGGTVHIVVRTIMHSRYDCSERERTDYDIGLLKTRDRMTLGLNTRQVIQPPVLATEEPPLEEGFAPTIYKLAGWGPITEDLGGPIVKDNRVYAIATGPKYRSDELCNANGNCPRVALVISKFSGWITTNMNNN